MSEILVVEQSSFDGSPNALFAAIEAGRVPGWRLPDGEALSVGTPLSMRLAAPNSLGRRHVDVLGRVSAIQWGRKLVISYHQPWQGKVTLTVTPSGSRRVCLRMVVTLAESAPAWLRRAAGEIQTGSESPADPEPAYPVGLLMSGSGAAGVFAPATENLARMAVDEINIDGGIQGLPVTLVVGDDASDASIGVAELGRLAGLGCRTVVTNVTSATFRRLQPLARRLNATLVFTPVNEGGPRSATILKLGERPLGQLRHSVPRLMQHTSETRWFLAGNDYCWPRITNKVAQRVIRHCGGSVIGERYQRLGSTDFSRLIDAIHVSGAELIISTFVGADEVAFEQQFYAAGLRDRCQTLSLALDESTRDYIGTRAAEGLWTSFGYFEQLDTPRNREFVARYRARFGSSAPPVSSISESVYEALHLYARAQHLSFPDGASSTRWTGLAFDGPRGPVRITEDALEQEMFLARATSAGFTVEAITL